MCLIFVNQYFGVVDYSSGGRTMKKILILFTVISVLSAGCSQQDDNNYSVWIDASTSTQASIDSALDRLTSSNVEFIVDDNGDILLNEKEMEKAVMCCS